MQELIYALTHPVNLVYTVLLGIITLYWLSVILGALDMGSIDFDLDADVDVDVDLDTDVGSPSVGWFAAALHFFNFGRLPFMVIMTIVIISTWTIAMLTNHYWGGYNAGFALVMAVPNLLLSFLIAKIVSTPLIPLFTAINQEARPVEYIGQTCIIKLPAAGDQFGQAEVNYEGDLLLIRFKTAQPTMNLQKGQSAVIVGRGKNDRYYLVESFDPPRLSLSREAIN